MAEKKDKEDKNMPLIWLFILVLLMFFIFGFLGNEWAMGLTLPFLLLIFFSITPSNISEFVFPGGKIKRVIQEAENKIEEVKELAKVLAESSLTNTARSGWLGGLEEEQRLAVLNSTREALKNLDIPQAEIEAVEKHFHECVAKEYAINILGGATLPRAEDTSACHKEWRELRGRKATEYFDPNDIRNFLKKWNFDCCKLEEKLKHYEHYLEYKEHKDFESYKKRDKWVMNGLKNNA